MKRRARPAPHQLLPATNYARDRGLVRRRIVVAGAAMIGLAIILVARFAYMQIGAYRQFDLQAEQNRVSKVPIPPVRGRIYDRNGEILAENTSVHALRVLPAEVEDMDELLDELARLVVLRESELRNFKSLLRRRPAFEWQTLRANLSPQEAAVLALNQHRYRGIELHGRLQRHYPRGKLTAHSVGYVGRLDADDLENRVGQDYQGVDYIGRSGLEAYYEGALFGKTGEELVETDAHGRRVRRLDRQPPQAGNDAHLSMDIQLQRASHELLRGHVGAIVALEPASGQILAFASAPQFDPNLFVNGIGERDYAALREAADRPLVNRALAGVYAPGSTIKSFMLLVGMENDVDPTARKVCRGWYKLPRSRRRFRDWKEYGHGEVDGHQAIVQSCDVYFYDLANTLGIDKIHAGLSRFGFGQLTGVDLPGEGRGLVPSPAHKRAVRGEPWYPGETVITGIGQGDMLVTPLQLAVTAATLANRGRRVIPRFLLKYENPRNRARNNEQSPLPPAAAGRIELKNRDSYELVIRAMRDVVHGPRGTARGSGRGLQYEMAGKTGTAQVVALPKNRADYDAEKVPKKHRDHSLFIGFAPVEAPKIAIAVVVENAGSGSKVAAPIARKLMDYYLLERGGLARPASVAAAEAGE